MNETTLTPGSRLKAEREQRGMSTQKAADEMHLDAWVIDALESGDYARIGPTVYVKGHLRRYAMVLGLPVPEILSDFAPQQPAAPRRVTSSIPVGSRHGAAASRGVSPGQAAASLVAVLLLIGVMWWQPWHQRNRTKTSSVPTASAVADSQGRNPAADAPATAQADDGLAGAPLSAQDYAPATAVTASGVTASGATAGGASPAAQSPGGPAGAGRARLRLSFTSSSWVDVRDALGNRTYAGNGSANTVKTIAGNAPLHVYLRSANGVQLEINGRAVAIGPQFFSGDAARFEAGADGVLRRDSARSEQTPARPHG